MAAVSQMLDRETAEQALVHHHGRHVLVAAAADGEDSVPLARISRSVRG